MICKVSKRFISREEDTGKTIPVLFQQHINRCQSCQEYSRFIRSLTSRAKNDASLLTSNTSADMIQKIKDKAAAEPKPARKHSRPNWLVPAASGAIAAVFLIVVLVFLPFRPSSRDIPGSRSEIYQAFTLSEFDLRSYTGFIDSPFESEWEGLKKAVKSSRDKLLPYLSLRLGQGE